MFVYRIASGKYIADLSGTGAKQYGGRWNEKGIAVVYFASSRAMAVMEVLVHLRPEELDREFVLATFEVPDEEVSAIEKGDLPYNWKSEELSFRLKDIGHKFVKDAKFLLLKVPSVLVEEEYNFILNPAHPSASQVKLVAQRPFKFDMRFKF